MGKKYPYDFVMKNDSVPFTLSPGAKSEVKCTFTNLRIDRDTVPAGTFVYEIMGTDSGSIGNGIIKEHVLVNHVGTLLTTTPLKMTHVDAARPWLSYRGVGSYSFD